MPYLCLEEVPKSYKAAIKFSDGPGAFGRQHYKSGDNLSIAFILHYLLEVFDLTTHIFESKHETRPRISVHMTATSSKNNIPVFKYGDKVASHLPQEQKIRV
jgi:hypothetical protein